MLGGEWCIVRPSSREGEVWPDMDLARRIQRAFMPDDVTAADYEVAGRMRPSTTVGGDFLDVVRRGSRLWVVMGDASAHGVTAAHLGVTARALARAALRAADGVSPASVVDSVVRALDAPSASLALLCLEPSGARVAGSCGALIAYRASSDRVASIEGEQSELALATGDALLMASDGLVEARRRGVLYGGESLEDAFRRCMRAGLSTSAIPLELLSSTDSFAISDDATAVVARRSHAPPDR